jgi:hypothetical protein
MRMYKTVTLYGGKIWLAFMENMSYMLLKILCKIFEFERDEISGQFKILHNE